MPKKLKRKVVRKPAAKKKIIRKAPAKKKKPVLKVKKAKGKKEQIVGLITHYFPHVNAGVIKLKAPLAVGDTIKIKGHTTDITQVIDSLQIDRTPVKNAKKGDEIGILVKSRVRRHDKVTKV